MGYKTKPHGTKCGTIENTALECIETGLSDQHTLTEVLRVHPQAVTSIGCIRWYRCALRGGWLWIGG